jgi:hypothetical protein
LRKIASSYQNVIFHPLWMVDLDQVCPPYLHILLGVTKRHHEMLEAECHVIYKLIAIEMSKTVMELLDTPFETYVRRLRHLNKMEMRRRQLLQQTRDDKITSKLQSTETEIRETKAVAKLNTLEGPVVCYLNFILKYHKITIQAYHGRSFVGNHCHLYLQPQILNDICGCVTEKASEYTGNIKILERTQEMNVRFTQLNTLYAKVHSLVGHGRPIPAKQLGLIQDSINAYMRFYRSRFNRVLPKMHMLEEHVVPWIRRWGVGMALHGEQGSESIHEEFNIQSAIASGIRCEVDQLVAMMRNHLTKCSPKIQSEVIHPKKRALHSSYSQ